MEEKTEPKPLCRCPPKALSSSDARMEQDDLSNLLVAFSFQLHTALLRVVSMHEVYAGICVCMLHALYMFRSDVYVTCMCWCGIPVCGMYVSLWFVWNICYGLVCSVCLWVI